MLKTKGYTLVEMIFVVSLCAMLSLISVNNQKIEITDDKIVSDLSLLFHKAKTYAMCNKENIELHINHKHITLISSAKEERYTLNHGNFKEKHVFHYNEQGHIYKAKTITYIGKDYIYDFVFQLGSGTYYVKKQRFIAD